jgi:hypothetical protein
MPAAGAAAAWGDAGLACPAVPTCPPALTRGLASRTGARVVGLECDRNG